jgi:hypothetical protein
VLNAEFPEDDDSSPDPTSEIKKPVSKPSTIYKLGGTTFIDFPSDSGNDLYGELFPGKKTMILDQEYDLRPLLNEMPYNLVIYNYWPTTDFKSPIIFEAKQASKFNVYVNNNHPLFKDFADGWDDLILMEIATRYYEKINNLDIWPVSRIYYELKRKYLGQKMLSVQALVAEAKALITDLQNFLVNEYGDSDLEVLPNLSIEQIKILKQNYLLVEMKSVKNVDDLIRTTQFLKYMDFAYIIDFAKTYPELIYDEKLFSLPYSTLDEDDIKIRQLEQYNGYFNDIKWFIYDLSNFTDLLIKQNKNLIIRNRFSLEFLNGKLA